MSDELVKRHIEQLRLTGGDLADLCRPLADAIEALTAERDEAWAYMSALQGDLYDAIMIKAERDRLRDATKRVTGRALQEIFVRRMGGAYVDDDPIELEGVSMDGYFNLIQIAEDIRNFICKGSDIDREHDDE